MNPEYNEVCFNFVSKGLGLWCLTPLSKIYQLYRGGPFYRWKETGGPGENQPPAASHWVTLSHNVVSSTPRLSGIQNVIFDFSKLNAIEINCQAIWITISESATEKLGIFE